jgi:hypothetical protein
MIAVGKPLPLSPRMAELVNTVATLTAERGVAPSLAEIGKAMGITAHRALVLAAEAERRGRLTHTPRVHRSWRVVKAAKAAK